MNFEYYNPVRIIFGLNSLNKLSSLVGNKRTLFITTSGFVNRGILDEMSKLRLNISYIINDVYPNPTFDYLREKYESLNYNKFDLIVALGGGSVIDTAKVLSVRLQSNNFDELTDYIVKNKKIKYNLKPVIAVPTTAGTSSEITPWATIWDNLNKKKYSLNLKDLWCSHCILDPNLTLTLPKNTTIYTALDAFSHSLESIWNKNSNPISLENAIFAARNIVEFLPLAVEDLSNIKYREKLMYASLKAGFAFSNTQTAIAHSISYYLTSNYKIPHGIACSFMIPDIIDIIIGKYEIIDNAINDIFGELNSRKVRKLYEKLGVSTNIKDYGIDLDSLGKLEESIHSTNRIKNSLIDNKELFNKFKLQLM